MSTAIPTPASSPPRERARAIAPQLSEAAEQAERERTLPAASVAALVESGLLRMPLPRELGGEEPDFEELLSTWEELARADGSAGWTAMANGSGAAAAAAYLSDDAVRAIFGDDPAATVGGQFAPRGTAQAESGGWRVTGNYSFGSGSGHAGFVSGGFMPLEDGAPRIGDFGLPEMHVGFVPRAQVEFLDNWKVMGLCGTGSYDYALHDVLVPEGFSFPLFCREPRRGSALFRLGMMPVTASGHAAWALGVARHALDEVRAIADERQRLGDTSALAGKATFQRDLARSEARLRAARGYVFDAFGALGEVAVRGDAPRLDERAEIRLATNLATAVNIEVCDFAHAAAGTVAVRDISALRRCFLDAHTGGQHAFISEKVWTDCGQVLLGAVEEVPGL